jgi:polyribonucleotide nucleotidyltransferase
VTVRVEKQIGSQLLVLETGFYAKQASAAVVVSYGDTVVLTAVATGPSRPGPDLLPHTSD